MRAGVQQPVPVAHAGPAALRPGRGVGVEPAGLGELALLVAQGRGDGLSHSPGPHREDAVAPQSVMDDGGMFDALDQLLAHPGVERSDQARATGWTAGGSAPAPAP